ncbi:phosphatidylglycerophosphatase A [bacterium]|nr:MAG: phosphatidylglycerophosphatase A [bacterium]
MNTLSMIFSTFFGTGFFPIAPGTAASFLTVLLYKLGLYKLFWPFQALIIVALFISGGAASTRYARLLNRKDPGRIVIDEICGQLIALFLVTPGWKELLLAFFLFRIFDIIKPYPIKKLEALPHGWGIMADDVGAGLAAAGFLRLILLFL